MAMFDPHTAALVPVIAAGGALAGLDRTAFGQFMASQPVVVGPVTGWLLGDLSAGLIIGVLLELLWLFDLPVGTFVPADTTVATVSATAIAVLGSQGQAPLELVGFAVLLTSGMVPICVIADTFVRKRNSHLVDSAVCASREGADLTARAHLSGLVVFFLKSFILIILFIPAGLASVALFQAGPGVLHRAMLLFTKLLPLLGAALVVNKISVRIFDGWLLAGFGVSALLVLLTPAHPLLIVAFVAGAGILWFSIAQRRSEQPGGDR